MKAVKISIIVQSTHEQKVRKALALVRTGKIGEYINCQFISRGEAQFEPKNTASLAIGEIGKLTKVLAVQIQTWCREQDIDKVVAVVKAAHPNEEPAIELIPFDIV